VVTGDENSIPARAVRWLRSVVQRLLTAPELKRLRWLLLLSGLIQFLLAPFSSWGSDTTSFILSELSFVYNGTPYASGLAGNPPLGPVLQLPLYAALSVFVPAQGFTQQIPSLVHISAVSGFVDPLIGTPVALLLLKLPLILVGLGTGGLLYVVMGNLGARRSLAEWAAAAWLLNPLVIWATAVNGEYDVLAAGALVGFFFFFYREQWMAAGFTLGLGCMGKLYPLVLVPAVAGLLIGWAGSGWRSWASKPLGGFLAGVVLGIAPFAFLIPTYVGAVTTTFGPVQAGGFSLAILFQGILLGSPLTSLEGTTLLLDVLAGILVATVVLSTLVVAWSARRRPADRSLRTRVLPVVVVWCVVAAIQYRPGPEPENFVGLIAVLPLASLALPQMVRFATIGASVAGFALYLAFATPAAFFYPLAEQVGPSWVGGANALVLSYFRNPYEPSRSLWFGLGLSGGVVMIVLWAACAVSFATLVRRPEDLA
jgi:hypothetical protein